MALASPTLKGAAVVLTTVGSLEAAETLALALLEERLCACVSILPGLRSLYRWKGKLQDDSEVMLLIKTTTRRLKLLEERLAELHPYEVPEFLALDPAKVSPAYARWLNLETEAV